jgi:transposase
VYIVVLCGDDVWMVGIELSGSGVVRRRRRSADERRRVVEETLEAGASVARVALKYGINANQVFQWRRLYQEGKLGAPGPTAMKLLAVNVADEEEPAKAEPMDVLAASFGAIHIELPGEVRISVEGSVDTAIIRAVLKSLRS